MTGLPKDAEGNFILPLTNELRCSSLFSASTWATKCRNWIEPIPVSEERKRQISEFQRTHTNSGRFKKGHEPWSKTHEYTVEMREKMSKAKDGMYLGEKNPNWKGGICNRGQMIRRNSKYAVWREEVFKRDNWTCQGCRTRGGYLHAHHIMFFSSFPEGRLLVANGQTLCIKCHRKLHKNIH